MKKEQKLIIEFTNFLMKESRKNYTSYSINKNPENTKLKYENVNRKEIKIIDFKNEFYIEMNNDTYRYEKTKNEIIEAKRDILNYIF